MINCSGITRDFGGYCMRLSGRYRWMATGLAVLAFPVAALSAAELAKVNGRGITDRDLRLALPGLSEGQRETYLRDPNSRRQVLVELINQELLVQEAEKLKLDQEQGYKDALGAFRRQFLAARVLEKNLASKVTDSAARKYFQANKSRFSTAQVHVQHILSADEGTARSVLAQAKKPEQDFQALAEKLSRDPSAKNNRGELGLITRDSPFVAEFKDAAFNAPENTIVGPVKTTYGYHVIKVLEKKVGRPLGYDEVELKVRGELRAELVNVYVGDLKNQAKVQVDDKALEKM